MPAATASLSELRTLATAPRQQLPTVSAGFFDLEGFELLQRVAKAFASSTLVPEAYRDNVANCMIALNLARRLRCDELMAMQNLYIVHGNPGWSAKFLIACVNTCGRYTSLRYEWRGKAGEDNYGCRAWAIEKSTNERLDGIWIDWKLVRAEKWHAKSGSKWLTMPDQMFIYRAAAFWQRGYAPEISMGLPSSEELHDVINVNADGTYTVNSESLRADMAEATPVVESTSDASNEGGKAEASDGTDPNAPSFASVMDLIQKVKNRDDEDAARDVIRSVSSEAHRKELLAALDAQIGSVQ